MGIVERIIGAKTSYINVIGMPPVHIYLGRNEDRELREWANKQKYSLVMGPIARPRIIDMYVYVVDAYSHMMCA